MEMMKLHPLIENAYKVLEGGQWNVRRLSRWRTKSRVPRFWI